MRTVNLRISDKISKYAAVIGRVGEYGVTEIVADLSEYVEDYGSGTASVTFVRMWESDPVLIASTFEDGILTIPINSELTQKAGKATMVINYLTDDGKKVSADIVVSCLRSAQNGGVASEAYSSWIDNATALLNEMQNADYVHEADLDAETARAEEVESGLKKDLSHIDNSDKSATSGYVWTATEEGAGWEESKGGASDFMVSITYSELKALKDSSSLVPGMQYRITDYKCGTVQTDARATNHPFDIIVIADNKKTLNHKARAILHDGDTYFANCQLEKWQVWYDLDLSAKYPWIYKAEGYIDSDGYTYILTGNSEVGTDERTYLECTSGTWSGYIVSEDDKFIACEEVDGFDDGWEVTHQEEQTADANGVVYRLIDDLGNDVPYDFKNIQFKRYKVNNTNYQSDDPDGDNYWDRTESLPVYEGYNGTDTNREYPDGVALDTEDFKWCYTFDDEDGNDTSLSADNYVNNNIFAPNDTFCYGLLNNVFFGQNCYNNTFGQDCSDNTFGQHCNYNIFGQHCNYNIFGQNCYRNTFGQHCNYNTFGQDCSNNTFGQNCYSNTFGQWYSSNTFGSDCSDNTFGQNCYRNTFGSDCSNNTFGQNCYNNTFGQDCSDNTFGQECYNNTFGQNCYSNTFGQWCSSNTFGQNCYSNTFGYGCKFIIFEKLNKYIKMDGDSTVCNGSYIKFLNGVYGSSINNPLVFYNASDDKHFNTNYNWEYGGHAEAIVECLTAYQMIRYRYVSAISNGKATYQIYYKSTLDGTSWSSTTTTL